MPIFKPRLFNTLKNYNKQQFVAYVKTKIIVGFVVLSFALVFDIVSGSTFEKETITAIIAGFIVFFLFESRVQIDRLKDFVPTIKSDMKE